MYKRQEYGWYEKDGDIFYLGGEDEGARTENQWLWLEKPSSEDEDHDDAANYLGCVDDNTDPCDDEGWYWFSSNGKMTRDNDKKKINGRYYFFNEHGQMLYEWINDRKVSGVAPASQSNPALDGSASPSGIGQVSHMVYANEVEEGWRADGWYEIDGSEDTKTDSDTDWYFFKDGKAKKADMAKDTAGIRNDDGIVYVARIKVDSPKGGKQYFAFNEYGQMQTGLQYIAKDKGFYYFDENGYPKSGKVTNVECDDDSYEFYFNTTKGKNGQGYTDGEKSGYLYFNGKKLTADDDYRLFFWNDKVYLVNTKGKIQKNNKKYDIENSSIDEDKVWVNFNSDDSVKEIILDEGKGTKYSSAQLLANSLVADSSNNNEYVDADGKYEDKYVTIPFIQLYDDDVYTYHFSPRSVNSDGVQTYTAGEKWYDIHETTSNKWK